MFHGFGVERYCMIPDTQQVQLLIDGESLKTHPQIRQKTRNLFDEMVLCFFIYGPMMVFIATFFDMFL